MKKCDKKLVKCVAQARVLAREITLDVANKEDGVASLEAVAIVIAAGLSRIADAIQDLAKAIREHQPTDCL